MHTARVIAALAVGTVAGEFFASPLARLLEAPLGDQGGLAAAIALPLAVAGVGVIFAGLTSAPKQARDVATGRVEAKA